MTVEALMNYLRDRDPDEDVEISVNLLSRLPPQIYTKGIGGVISAFEDTMKIHINLGSRHSEWGGLSMMNKKERANEEGKLGLLKEHALEMIDGKLLLFLFEHRGRKSIHLEAIQTTFGSGADDSLGRLEADGHIMLSQVKSFGVWQDIVTLTDIGDDLARELHQYLPANAERNTSQKTEDHGRGGCRLGELPIRVQHPDKHPRGGCA